MTCELPINTDPVSFRGEVRAMHTSQERLRVDEAVRLCHLGGGVIKFAETIFPGISATDIQAEVYEREPEGRGAHFDVYDETLVEEFPYLGVFNLDGEVEVTAAELPDDLAKIYFERFPEPNDTAFKARRDFSSIALNLPDTKIYKGTMEAGSGMVLLQNKEGPHIIHNVVPRDPSLPGKFIKLVYTSGSPQFQDVLEKTALRPLDEVLSAAVAAINQPPLKASARQSIEDVVSEFLPPYSDCNLD